MVLSLPICEMEEMATVSMPLLEVAVRRQKGDHQPLRKAEGGALSPPRLPCLHLHQEAVTFGHSNKLKVLGNLVLSLGISKSQSAYLPRAISGTDD
jgi:hypothetical protein